MNKNKLIDLLIISLVIFSFQSCKKKNTQNTNAMPVPVKVYDVQSQTVHFYNSFPGTVVALNEVQLHSQVSGYITGIFFKEGTQVVSGQKLYEIDRRKYQATFQQAKAGVDIANANLEKAKRDADRYTKLNEQNAIAKQTFDDAITNLQFAKVQLTASRAALLNAQTDYNFSIIKAPFAGTIGLSQVKPGTFINAGQTLLNSISSDDPIGVDFIINEESLPSFLELRNNTSAKADSTFRILLPDNTEYRSNGQLSVIDRAVDPQTGTIKIRLVFPNHDKILRTGMNCKVKVLGGTSGTQVIIPYKAVIEQMGEYFVYAIDSMKAKQMKIEPGSNLGEFIVVKKGVKQGDKIVLEGLQKIRNGALVKIINMPAQDSVKNGNHQTKQDSVKTSNPPVKKDSAATEKRSARKKAKSNN